MSGLAPGEVEAWAEQGLERISDHLRYCFERGYDLGFQMTQRIGREAFQRSRYLDDLWLCSHLERKVGDRRAHVKPAGTYLIMTRPVVIDLETSADRVVGELFQSYEDLKAYAQAHGYQIIGDVYETELSIYAGDLNGIGGSQIEAQIGTAGL
ncbi:MAG: hypothetical protein LBU05_01795 [Bifidobacteriaceae bacterium]|jgi:hypothetical protein|nr:hypothetical protein [Bifidobacteriaceae bacterium]